MLLGVESGRSVGTLAWMVLVVRSEHDRDVDRCIVRRQERDHEQSRALSLLNADGSTTCLDAEG